MVTGHDGHALTIVGMEDHFDDCIDVADSNFAVAVHVQVAVCLSCDNGIDNHVDIGNSCLVVKVHVSV